jgi:hypothetical protein
MLSAFVTQVDASPSSKLQKLLLESRQMIANLEKTAKGNNIKEVKKNLRFRECYAMK